MRTMAVISLSMCLLILVGIEILGWMSGFGPLSILCLLISFPSKQIKETIEEIRVWL